MRWSRYAFALFLMAAAGQSMPPVLGADGAVTAGASRVEVVLSSEYRNQLAVLKEEFARAGMPNVHFQFVKLGQPPQNIGLGREVPADTAREAIRLAVKYNLGVGILLPERLFPPRFITIASSNYDDTVEYPIDQVVLELLRQPALTTEEFHQLYRRFTSTPKTVARRY